MSATVVSPVEQIPGDDQDQPPEPGLALCLSGGGYRAMLFHLGALWRLNEVGYLPKLDRVSSVSGGSITAAVLGLAWAELAFDGKGVGRGFERGVVEPIRRLAGETVDVGAVLGGILGRGTINDRVVRAYRKHLFGTHTLQDLPGEGAGPRFVINAANLQSGALWRFSKPYARDHRVGNIADPRIELALAVAASSAFPPVLSPAVLDLAASDYAPRTDEDLHRPPYTTRVVLTDGGVYDNLGLETAWKRYTTILVSDGGGKMGPEARPKADWLRHMRRVLDVIDNQVRSLRKRQLIASYQLPPGAPGQRDGAYWGIRTDIRNYELPDALPCPLEQTTRLAAVPTRLSRMSPVLQQRLINWGYAVCDAALRRHVAPELAPPSSFPYREVRVG